MRQIARFLSVTAVLALAGGLAVTAHAGPQDVQQVKKAAPDIAGEKPSRGAASVPGAEVLSGPKVDETAGRSTLVEYDFQGRVERLETSPEEAALGMLKLDEATKKATAEILAERTAVLDKIVVENIPLLIRFQTAQKAGDKRDLADLTKDLAAKLEPLRDKGKLKERLLVVLPEDQRSRFDTLVTGYWKAVLDEARDDAAKQAKEAGKRSGRLATTREALRKEIALAVGQEIKRSYERTIGQRAADFEKLLADLGLDPETERKVRGMVTDHVQKYLGSSTPAQNRELFFRILSVLNEEQRAKAIELARERYQ
jgi:hypothetical protein